MNIRIYKPTRMYLTLFFSSVPFKDDFAIRIDGQWAILAWQIVGATLLSAFISLKILYSSGPQTS